MPCDLHGLDVVIGRATTATHVVGSGAAGLYTPGHGSNMGPGGKNLTEFYGKDMWQKENFWRGWGGDTEIDELDVVGDATVGAGFDLATWQQQGETLRNWETAFESGDQIRGDRGHDLVGGYDIAAWQRQMNTLKQVPLLVAQVLLSKGQQAIDGAMKAAKQPWYKADLPGETRRNEVMWKLQWHADNMAKVAPSAWQVVTQYQSGDKDAFKKAGAQYQKMYGSAADLIHWTMQAFVEANAAEEGAAYLDAAWKQMWVEIKDAVAALPGEIAKKVTEVGWWLKWTYWAAIGAGVVALALVGWGAGSGIKSRLSK